MYGDHVSLFTLLMTSVHSSYDENVRLYSSQDQPGMKMMMYMIQLCLGDAE